MAGFAVFTVAVFALSARFGLVATDMFSLGILAWILEFALLVVFCFGISVFPAVFGLPEVDGFVDASTSDEVGLLLAALFDCVAEVVLLTDDDLADDDADLTDAVADFFDAAVNFVDPGADFGGTGVVSFAVVDIGTGVDFVAAGDLADVGDLFAAGYFFAVVDLIDVGVLTNVVDTAAIGDLDNVVDFKAVVDFVPVGDFTVFLVVVVVVDFDDLVDSTFNSATSSVFSATFCKISSDLTSDFFEEDADVLFS